MVVQVLLVVATCTQHLFTRMLNSYTVPVTSLSCFKQCQLYSQCLYWQGLENDCCKKKPAIICLWQHGCLLYCHQGMEIQCMHWLSFVYLYWQYNNGRDTNEPGCWQAYVSSFQRSNAVSNLGFVLRQLFRRYFHFSNILRDQLQTCRRTTVFLGTVSRMPLLDDANASNASHAKVQGFPKVMVQKYGIPFLVTFGLSVVFWWIWYVELLIILTSTESELLVADRSKSNHCLRLPQCIQDFIIVCQYIL